MGLDFDFRLHVDRSLLSGTCYFEFAPGPYSGRCWAPGSRFIHEYTFCLFEGILEKHAQGFGHFSFVEVPRAQWELILRDLAALRAALTQDGGRAALPYGSTWKAQDAFEQSLPANQRALATLLSELETWLRQVCVEHEVISVLGI